MNFLKFLFSKKMPLSKVVAKALVVASKPAKASAKEKGPVNQAAASPKSDRFGYAGDLLDVDSAGYFIEPEESYDLDIVGEATYQRALEAIAGPKVDHGVNHECKAVLKCENDNKFDKNAVEIKIQNMTVGYLAKADAKLWRQMLKKQKAAEKDVRVNALIVGGWKANDKKGVFEGHFGVKLDVPIDED